MNTQELVANCKEQFNNAFGENPQKVVLSPEESILLENT